MPHRPARLTTRREHTRGDHRATRVETYAVSSRARVDAGRSPIREQTAGDHRRDQARDYPPSSAASTLDSSPAASRRGGHRATMRETIAVRRWEASGARVGRFQRPPAPRRQHRQCRRSRPGVGDVRSWLSSSRGAQEPGRPGCVTAVLYPPTACVVSSALGVCVLGVRVVRVVGAGPGARATTRRSMLGPASAP